MTIKDSGERTVYDNGFQRDMHEGKGRMDLIPWRAIMELSKHCEEGAKKYGERNVDKGCPQHSLIDSAFRHLAKYTIGEDDEPHLRAAFWNIAWALEQEVCRPDMQDIPARKKPSPEHPMCRCTLEPQFVGNQLISVDLVAEETAKKINEAMDKAWGKQSKTCFGCGAYECGYCGYHDEDITPSGYICEYYWEEGTKGCGECEHYDNGYCDENHEDVFEDESACTAYRERVVTIHTKEE